MAKKKQKFEPIEAEMTPMIDVTFLLLIFFIVTLKFRTLEGRLDASLPKDKGTRNTQQEEIETVQIDIRVANPGVLRPDPETGTASYPEGRLNKYYGRKVVFQVGSQTFETPEEVSKYLSTFDKDETPIVISPLKKVIYADVVKILDVVIALEFKQVSFAGAVEEE